jgi:hypothetical protein
MMTNRATLTFVALAAVAAPLAPRAQTTGAACEVPRSSRTNRAPAASPSTRSRAAG